MRHGVLVLVSAAAEFALALVLGPPWVALLGWVAAVTTMVGTSMLVGWTALLSKEGDGSIPAWSYLAFWPWHGLLRGALLLRRRFGAEPLLTTVYDGWILGGWPEGPEDGDGVWERPPAVLDMTCELPRRALGGPYRCLPTWDGCAPPLEEFERAVRWAVEQRRAGHPVLVHCAGGHGRSATALAACLVLAKKHKDWQEALDHVIACRPRVAPSAEQEELLRRWQARR